MPQSYFPFSSASERTHQIYVVSNDITRGESDTQITQVQSGTGFWGKKMAKGVRERLNFYAEDISEEEVIFRVLLDSVAEIKKSDSLIVIYGPSTTKWQVKTLQTDELEGILDIGAVRQEERIRNLQFMPAERLRAFSSGFSRGFG